MGQPKYQNDGDPPALVVQAGSTKLRYHLRCIDDLPAMLAELEHNPRNNHMRAR
ncbi:MAG: DUF6855 family protein [Egibacteraceae bacterium]